MFEPSKLGKLHASGSVRSSAPMIFAARAQQGYQQAKVFLQRQRRLSASLPSLTPEPVRKAALGRSIPVGRSVARVVQEEFAQREAGARRNDSRLQAALLDPILSLLRRSAREQLKDDDSLSVGDLARELVKLAKLRSIATASSVNDTTDSIKATMALQGGAYEGEGPYSSSRAATIGITEGSWATFAAELAALSLKGVKRWTWRTTPTCKCKDCLSLAGKTLKVGEEFVSKSGARAQHPPLHPNCSCTCEAKR